jgi:hypothetical protein
MRRCTTRIVLAALLSGLLATAASVAPVYWTDWTGGDLDPGVGFRAQGTIATPSSSVTIAYTNAAGVSFYQSSGGTDY